MTVRRSHRGTSTPSWYRIKNLAGAGTAEVHIYNEIGLYGVTAASMIGELSQLQVACLDVHINSPGGEIFEGLAILNALRAHPAAVNVYVDGCAASIASVIAMAGDRITMMPNSQMMVHDGSGLCVGNEADMREMADLLGKQSENIASIYAQRAGGSRPQWRKRMRDETWYSAQEAVTAGLADEVAKLPARQQIPEPAPEEEQYATAAAFDLSMFRYPGREKAPAPPLSNQDQPAGAPEETDAEDLTDTAVPVHHTDTVDTSWDGGEAERRLPSPMSVATARSVYSWYDAEQVEDGMLPKQAAKLPHHEVDAGGDPGAANLPAVRNALARLSQSDIPQSDWDAIRAHLEAHLADGQPPEEAHTEIALTAWSPDMFRTAVAKASGLPPEDLPDTFRNAVFAAAGTAPAIAVRAEPVPAADRLGWNQPAPVDESAPVTPGSVFRDVVAREANHAPAVISTSAPHQERESYDPTVVIRALREANQQ